MLTALDETLHHQCSETFANVETSDHRFSYVPMFVIGSHPRFGLPDR